MTQQEYINWLAPRVVLDSLDRNLLPSPRIAQGCFEPAYGTSELAVNANNLFGVKNNDQWEGKCYNKETKESYDGVTLETVNEDFQAYDSWEDSIYWQGWYLENRCTTRKYHPELRHYAELIGNRDYKDCARILDEKNYGTSPEYAKRVIYYVEKHNLTQYDTMTREEALAMIQKEGEKKKMIINVHAGHNPDGKVACGAIGFLKESTENRNVKNEVIRQLQALGHTVYDCTVEDGTSSKNVLTKIVAKCNSHEVELDVAIHFNCCVNDQKGDGNTTGVEVLVYGSGSDAIPYAQATCDAIAALGYKNRGVKFRPGLYVLKNTKAPAMLIECCFVDDKDDVMLYNYKDMAEAIVYGITGQKYEEPTADEGDEEAAAPGAETATGDEKALYRVQVGAYGVKANAEAMQRKLKNVGFDSIIVKA